MRALRKVFDYCIICEVQLNSYESWRGPCIIGRDCLHHEFRIGDCVEERVCRRRTQLCARQRLCGIRHGRLIGVHGIIGYVGPAAEIMDARTFGIWPRLSPLWLFGLLKHLSACSYLQSDRRFLTPQPLRFCVRDLIPHIIDRSHKSR